MRYAKTKDEIKIDVLKYLANYQGQWVCLWYGYFKEIESSTPDVYYAMPENYNHKLALDIMKNLLKRELIGGCSCGCRGDFEITDKGLALIGRERVKKYSGY